MAQDRTIHTKHLGDKRYRDLNVYYEKDGLSFWDYSQKPKGIYFASSKYKKSGTTTTWSTGQKGDGYMLTLNQTGFIGDHKAWKVSHDQRKFRKPFFDRSSGARSALGT